MADPYSQALNIAAPFSRLGSQMFQGQALYEQGRAKSALQEAQRSAMESHSGLYNAQAQKAQEEAAGLAQRRQYQTPEFASQIAATLNGLSPEQGTELASGNAPWATPEQVQSFNRGRGAHLAQLGATGDTNGEQMIKAFGELLGQGRTDQAIASPKQAGIIAQGVAAGGGKPLVNNLGGNGVFNQFTGGQELNAVGNSAVMENRAQANNANASASAALARSKIGQPTVNPDGSVTSPVTSFGKAPAGYRFKQDGSLEPIPGGPVDAKINSPQKIQDANDVLSLLDLASPLIEGATGSYLGSGIDFAGRVIGQSTKGAESAAQLKAIEGALISKMPKMSGPQSDKDVLLYKQMAGQIGDSTIPPKQKKSAMVAIKNINDKYSQSKSTDKNIDALLKKYWN